MKYDRQKGQTTGKALYLSWIEKNIKNTPPFQREEKMKPHSKSSHIEVRQQNDIKKPKQNHQPLS